MQPHQQRVVDEKTELETKLTKLDQFINESAMFPTLVREEQVRLTRQRDVMTEYAKILGERIAAFPA